MQENPKDLGRRIVEAAHLAVALHLQHSFGLQRQIGGADREGAMRADGALANRRMSAITDLFAEWEAE
jgi:hypothetical protein